MLPSFLKLHHQERHDDDPSLFDHDYDHHDYNHNDYNHNDYNHDNQVSNIGLGSLKAFSSDDCELNEELVCTTWKTSTKFFFFGIFNNLGDIIILIPSVFLLIGWPCL